MRRPTREQTDLWLEALEPWQWDAVRLAIEARRPSLCDLPEDVLFCVLQWLADPTDRLAFATALLANARSHDAFASVTALEYAILSTCDAVHAVADATLYTMYRTPRCLPLCRCALVVADWSVFTSGHVQPLARVAWSGMGPYARCEVDLPRVRAHVSACMQNGRSALRLGAIPLHSTWVRLRMLPNKDVARVYVNGRLQLVHKQELASAMVCFFDRAAHMRTLVEHPSTRTHLQRADVAGSAACLQNAFQIGTFSCASATRRAAFVV